MECLSSWSSYSSMLTGRDLRKIGAAIAIVVVIVLVGVLITSSRKEDGDVCKTPSCQKAAERLMSYIDHSADPCDDFYRYSCGKWLDENQMGPAESSRTTFSLNSIILGDRLKQIVDEGLLQNDSSSAAKLRNFYSSCVDTCK